MSRSHQSHMNVKVTSKSHEGQGHSEGESGLQG